MLTLNLRLLVIGAIAAITLMIVSTTAFAKHNDNTRPGWGFGDQNHVHTGPPGHSVHPVVNQTNNSTSNFSANISANTGGNTAENGNVETGPVGVNVSVVNNMGQNVYSP